MSVRENPKKQHQFQPEIPHDRTGKAYENFTALGNRQVERAKSIKFLPLVDDTDRALHNNNKRKIWTVKIQILVSNWIPKSVRSVCEFLLASSRYVPLARVCWPNVLIRYPKVSKRTRKDSFFLRAFCSGFFSRISTDTVCRSVCLLASYHQYHIPIVNIIVTSRQTENFIAFQLKRWSEMQISIASDFLSFVYLVISPKSWIAGDDCPGFYQWFESITVVEDVDFVDCETGFLCKMYWDRRSLYSTYKISSQ